MPSHLIKLGVLLVTVVALTFAYFHFARSVDRQQIAKQSHTHKQLAQQHQKTHNKTTVASTRHRHHSKMRSDRRLAKLSHARIKPMTTLRKSQSAPHFGPPSKMYGSL